MVRNIGVSVVSPRRLCEDPLCPFHGTLPVRGKLITGVVTSANAKKMAVVSREYPKPVPKYKRYQRSRSKVHAFLPDCITVKEGDEVIVAECRPLSKTISFAVIQVNSKDVGGSKV
jgi:small subunit ribosomal protein S17